MISMKISMTIANGIRVDNVYYNNTSTFILLGLTDSGGGWI